MGTIKDFSDVTTLVNDVVEKISGHIPKNKIIHTSFPSINLRRDFKYEQKIYDNYKKLYDELTNAKIKLKELQTAYEEELRNTDFKTLKDTILSLTPKQAEYFAILLRLYQKKLSYVDIKTLQKETKKDRRTIEKFLSGNKDSKVWRRGSRKIIEICEKKHLKVGNRKRVCFIPKGIFEVISRYLAQFLEIGSLIEKVLREMIRESDFILRSNSELLEYTEYMKNHLIKIKNEKLIEIPSFRIFLSEIASEIGRKLSEEEVKDVHRYWELLKKINKKLEHDDVLGRLIDHMSIYVLTIKKIIENAKVVRATNLRLLKTFIKGKRFFEQDSGNLFIFLREKMDQSIFQQISNVQSVLNSIIKKLIYDIDEQIFTHELILIKGMCLDPLMYSLNPILDFKRSLDDKFESGIIERETYNRRLEELAIVAKNIIEEQRKAILSRYIPNELKKLLKKNINKIS